jgi:hypothetical protein
LKFEGWLPPWNNPWLPREKGATDENRHEEAEERNGGFETGIRGAGDVESAPSGGGTYVFSVGMMGSGVRKPIRAE